MSDLKKLIYKAQCIGNVEPIEYMVPYPNLRALIEGQNIKYGKKMVYADYELSSDKIYRMAQQSANLFLSLGVKPKERVMIQALPFPESEIAMLGAWTLGSSLVFTSDHDYSRAIKASKPSLIISQEMQFLEKIKEQSDEFIPKVKAFLEDEAVVFWTDGRGIRLSHYNILVNTNGIQHAIDLYEDQFFDIKIEANSMPWVILKVVLPLYSGAPISKDKADISFGEKDADYIIKYNWDSISNSLPNELNVCNENSGFISIGKEPIHLTEVNDLNKPTAINGHSVMMGYLNKKENKKVFKKGRLYIQTKSD
ncbi:MAG: hypothetical protein CBE10_02360 [bacterium TMED250]|nr:MAG: hypothetical protein CBE10_02360 [bacterium TMED250]|tara:strand:- start:2827 stop:3756 length:930 start_codon:yes stop_codon:yes gene_type:complete